MLTTTIAFSPRAAAIRLRWPAWRAPIVGTSPTSRPWACHRRDAASIAAGLSNTANGLSGAVPDLFFFSCRRRRRAVGRVFVLGSRKLAAGYLFGEPLGGGRDLLGKVGVALDELGRLARRQAEHVVVHQHLPVCARTGADADRRDPQGLGDLSAEFARS